ncbi:ATP-binding protein [Bacillus subtilis]|uniref:ATP-binding protein n=1 Tax=Bacillus subtilis TaxID=1423 RepID=UPI0013633CBF|nr:AAA family ATPase [Bacillus subtilis]MBO3636607.1 AAA family ATPase [Bacillus subtilis]QHK00035.1 DNA replication and repair protein RecF [Bacillus subtilis]WIY65899.1 AAA family ATPase [Bacillus subtilis]
MGFYINKIYIKNFKLFNNVAQPIELKSKNLTVLDGPNGFGKTSIFDVIEIILTGRLKRIRKSDGRTSYKELLLQNDKSIESILKIEFVNESGQNKFTVVKRIESNFTTEKNSPDDFEIFQTHLLSDFNQDLNEGNLITNNENIIQKFGVDVKNIFNLVYYIEQEENKFFLRMNEGDRLNQISLLFNTENEQADERYYKDVRTKVNTKRNQLSTEINQLTKSIRELKLDGKNEVNDSEYLCLFPNLTPRSLVPWDLKELSINDHVQKERYITELDNIKRFLNSFNDFIAETENKVIKRFLDNEKLIKDFVVIKSKDSIISTLIDRFNKQKEVYRIVKELEKSSFMIKWKEIDFKKINEFQKNTDFIIMSDDSYRNISKTIDELINYEKNSSQISASLSELVNLREGFVEKYKKHQNDHSDIKDGECPLCGAEWETFENLVEVFEKKKDFLQDLLDDTSNKINDSLEKLHSKEIENIIINTEEYFTTKNTEIISSNNFKQMNQIQNEQSKVEELQKWFIEKNIDFSSFLRKSNDYIEPVILEEIKIQLMDILTSNYKQVTKEISSEDLIVFNSIYKRYFLNKSDLVEACKVEFVDKKINYINQCYYNNIFEEKKELKKKLDKITGDKLKYDALYNDLSKIISDYTSKTKAYWKKIRKDIEIVFYIYSAKILQSHQQGLGIFMKESDSKIIRFITHPEKDHDISNFMSSGQLSASILALTLSLNKVYGNQGLSTLLIDDPLQTMDDINISSFVELLRNDFHDKQIILSTHEEDVTNYMLYKFSNYNLVAQSMNLKDKYFSENKS